MGLYQNIKIMKKSELRKLIREEVNFIKESRSDKYTILGSFPGEIMTPTDGKRYSYMFYYQLPDDTVWFIKGKGKYPVKIADSKNKFMQMVKSNRVRIELGNDIVSAFPYKHPHGMFERVTLNESITTTIKNLTLQFIFDTAIQQGAESKIKSYHGMSPGLPDANSAGSRTNFPEAIPNSHKRFEEWKREFLKRWGDSKITIDFKKPIGTDYIYIHNKKYNDWFKQSTASISKWLKENSVKNISESSKYDIKSALWYFREFNRGNIGIKELTNNIITSLGFKLTKLNIKNVESHISGSINDNDILPIDKSIVIELYKLLK